MADAVVSEKQCGRCGEVKAAKHFSINRASKDGLFRVCRPCASIVIYGYRHKPDPVPEEYGPPIPPAERTCSRCKETLPISQFSTNVGTKSGYHSHCRSCQKARRESLGVAAKSVLIVEKTCSQCTVTKPASEFHRNSATKDQLDTKCKPCRAVMAKAYRDRNPEKVKQAMAAWYAENRERQREYGKRYYVENGEEVRRKRREYCRANPEKVKQGMMHWASRNRDRIRENGIIYRAANKEKVKANLDKWRSRNKDRIRGYMKKIKSQDKYRVSLRVSNAMRRSLKDRGSSKGGVSWCDLVGYSKEALVKHLKKTIPPGYTWQDFLDGELEIDHIVPVSAHNFSSPEDPDFLLCWSKRNLRLLPSRENKSKGAKLLKPFQPSLSGI